MIQHTTIPNLDIIGLMVRDRNRYPSLHCPCIWCDSILAEAAERMTNGGVQVVDRQWPGRLLIAYDNNEPNPRTWGHLVVAR